MVAPARGADGPQITVNISPDVSVRITNFRFDHSSADMTAAFRYDLENTSGQGLVAIEVRWEASFDANHTVTFTNRDDRWLTGILPTNHTEQFLVTNVPNVPAQGPVRHVSATVAYAEFEDGTALGTDAARSVVKSQRYGANSSPPTLSFSKPTAVSAATRWYTF